MARMPDPVPISKKDCGSSCFLQAVSCCRQNAVVGCWPVPKLNPGSRMIVACPLRARRALQLGLINKADPTSMGLKWRFQECAQSRGFNFRQDIRKEPGFNPQR